MDEHTHSWIANSGRGGEPAYKPGPNGPRAPHVMHVRCDGCGARTWLTRAEWEVHIELHSKSGGQACAFEKG
jgi:hypothetical protein